MKQILAAIAVLGASAGGALAGGPLVSNAPQCNGFPAGAASVECSCTGSESGSVWGSGPYTADSDLCVAARHAGVIGANGGTIQAIGAPGQSAYPGSVANGVTTANWGSYGASFDFVRRSAGLPACGAFPGGDGPYQCQCSGNESGSVWGSGPYTSDSDLCAAARHAGVIGARGGAISVLRAPGLPGYSASTANGVSTQSWGSYGSSVVFNRN